MRAVGLAGLGCALTLACGDAGAEPRPAPPAEPPPRSLDAPPSAEGCAPAQLITMTIRNISPGVAAAARAAQPRKLWRKGATYLRSEDDPDPVRGDQTVVIISEPDIWTINLATRTGTHASDPGPELNVRAPILPPVATLPAPLRALEFGCEPQWVAAYAPQEAGQVNWGSSPAILHTLVVGEHSIAMLMEKRRNIPILVSYLRQGRPVMVIRYDLYRTDLPDRPELFAPGANIKITERPPTPPPSPLPSD